MFKDSIHLKTLQHAYVYYLLKPSNTVLVFPFLKQLHTKIIAQDAQVHHLF